MLIRQDDRRNGWIVRIWPYLASSGLVILAASAGLVIKAWIDPPNVSMVFLTAVLVSAVAFGLWPSLYASILSTFAYNFFFLDPLYSLTIADPANIIALVFLLIVAILTSDLTARLRAQVAASRQRAEMTEALYEFSRKLTGISRMDDLLWAIAHQIALMLRAKVVLLLPENGALRVMAGYPPEDQLAPDDLAAADVAWLGSRPAGRDADPGTVSQRLFLPMRSVEGPVGVMGIERARSPAGSMFGVEDRRLLDALADQSAIAIERLLLAQQAEKTRLAEATEQLRLALLSAISHDFRTPLASIIGSASSLKSLGDRFDRATQVELLDTIREEAERLNRFVGNVLDMTRLESGEIRPRLVAVDLAESLIGAADDLAQGLAQHRLQLNIAADLPLLRLDPVLFRHVVGNLLDNAAKYSPAGTMIEIRAHRREDGIAIDIVDEGPGIPPEDLGQIFERFFRAGAGDRRRAGSGLGLAICRGFVEAMGGTISAHNRTDRPGAVFSIAWPVSAMLDDTMIKE